MFYFYFKIGKYSTNDFLKDWHNLQRKCYEWSKIFNIVGSFFSILTLIELDNVINKLIKTIIIIMTNHSKVKFIKCNRIGSVGYVVTELKQLIRL